MKVEESENRWVAGTICSSSPGHPTLHFANSPEFSVIRGGQFCVYSANLNYGKEVRNAHLSFEAYAVRPETPRPRSARLVDECLVDNTARPTTSLR